MDTQDDKAAAPIAQQGPPPPAEKREVRFDTMKDRIKLLPGWDDPIDLGL